MGKAFAESLAARGVHSVLVALEGEKLVEIARGLEKAHGVQSIALPMDLSVESAAETLRKEVEARGLTIDILINAAGFGYFGDFSVMPYDQIGKMMAVNVTSIVQLCRLYLPGMQQRKKGVIINIASIAGLLPYPLAAVYCATKGFMHFFTQALWAENPVKEVRILSLCPGYSKTNFERVSQEPSGIHLFQGEEAADIAEKTLKRLPKLGHSFFTRPSHPFKVMAAKLLPLKLFAWMLRRLSGIPAQA